MSYRRKWKNKGNRRKEEQIKEPDNTPQIAEANLANKDVQIYLVKMPAFLVDHFEQNDEIKKNEVVGRLRIPTRAEAKSGESAKIFLDKVMSKPKDKNVSSSATPKAENIPISTEYELTFNKGSRDPKILVFSQNKNGDDVDLRMEGKVSFQCMARPKMDRTYRDMNKRRTLLSMQKTREIKRMDERERRAYEREAIQPMSMMESAREKEERKQRKEDARRHLDVPDEKWKEITTVAVFKAFEIQPHYSADELASVVNEPVSRLKSVMSDVCVYNKSGPYVGRYELKDEFKTAEQRKQKAKAMEEFRLEQIDIAKRRREERAERERDGPPSKKSRQL